MKVRFRQTGGFAGLVRGCELTSDALAPAELAELRRLVDAAALERVAPSLPRGADRQSYEIAVERDTGAPVALTLSDSDLTDDIAALVAFLRARAKPMRLG